MRFPSLLCAALAAALPAQIDAVRLEGMQCRSIGPAGMSGRVASIDAVHADPTVIWVGAATGGVWKSTNGGLTFAPMFDEQPVAAIGAVAICQSQPDVVWVGTGEGNPRNSASVGNGVYKTLDGGKTWTHCGLEATGRIHRIVLHPRNADVAWVAALGRAWGENEERGVFKTTDGGRTWTKVLYVDQRTGAADLVIDPGNPDKLLAAMWDYRRWPWSFRSGGPGSGLHATRDGGSTWSKLGKSEGLPDGELGRIGLAIAPSDPRVVYALIEAERNALLRSDDGWRTFRTVNRETDVAPRPFYYADIRVDPERPDRVYSLHSQLTVSDDGGRTFRPLGSFREVHPDHHELWIDPRDPRHLFNGNDGGVYESRDRGASWRFVSNLPLAQFYHVRVDMDVPFNVYGGLQDNGSWRGPSTVWENGGIRNHHWAEVGFGDGFDTLPDPQDSMAGYAMSQQGYLMRWDLRTGERENIRPAAHDDTELRFNWNAGIAQDPFEPGTIWFCSQFVHRSRDRGASWEVMSGDLTSNNPEWLRQPQSGGLTLDVTGAENFCTIIAIAPSPVRRGQLWVGTDDGRIHVTSDGGASWASVEQNLPDVPANTWVPHIVPSQHAADAAYVVLDDHRRSNWTPYVFETTDNGASWKSLASADLRGYCLSLAEDPVDRNLLFLGTEFGLWFSVDRGAHWQQWTHGLPTVSVHDLVVHPRDGDLVIGTHGRAIFVLDDVAPLRGLRAETLAKPLHFFAVPDAQQYQVRQTGASRFPGSTEFRGETRPYGALLTFVVNGDDLPARENLPPQRGPRGGDDDDDDADAEGERGGKRVTVRVRDAQGNQVRKLERPVHRGVNRIAWDLRTDGPKSPPQPRGRRGFDRERGGPEVLPGSYTVELQWGEHKATQAVRVLADPRQEIAKAEREAKQAALQRTHDLQNAVTAAIERVQKARADLKTILARAGEKNDDGKAAHPELVETGKALSKALDDLEKKLWTPPDTKGITRDEHAMARLGAARGALSSSWGAPKPDDRRLLELAERDAGAALDALNRFTAESLEPFRARVEAAGIGLLAPAEPLRIK
jgi:photosystem II stability/assembly factor-like uncharacterized protein